MRIVNVTRKMTVKEKFTTCLKYEIMKIQTSTCWERMKKNTHFCCFLLKKIKSCPENSRKFNPPKRIVAFVFVGPHQSLAFPSSQRVTLGNPFRPVWPVKPIDPFYTGKQASPVNMLVRIYNKNMVLDLPKTQIGHPKSQARQLQRFTLPETNIAPRNGGFHLGISFSSGLFSGVNSLLVSGRVHEFLDKQRWRTKFINF